MAAWSERLSLPPASSAFHGVQLSFHIVKSGQPGLRMGGLFAGTEQIEDAENDQQQNDCNC